MCRPKDATQKADNKQRFNRKHKLNQLVNGGGTPSHVVEDGNDLYSLFALKENKHAADQECPRINVEICGSLVELGVDTQASLNAMSKETYEKLENKPNLTSCPIMAFSYDGKTPLQPLGEFKALTKANGRSMLCDFVVFDGVRDNLLGFKSCIHLGLIELTYAIGGEDAFTADVKAKYPSLFTGRIGKLKGVELRLHIDRSIKPVTSPSEECRTT